MSRWNDINEFTDKKEAAVNHGGRYLSERRKMKKKKYVVESRFFKDGDWCISRASDSREGAEQEQENLINSLPADLGIECRITEMQMPDGPQNLFCMLAERLENEGTVIDDVSADSFSLHITWGDWKHDHAHADRVMKLFGFVLDHETETEEDGSDCYSAWRTYSYEEKGGKI